jgi:hypothetical protein
MRVPFSGIGDPNLVLPPRVHPRQVSQTRCQDMKSQSSGREGSVAPTIFSGPPADQSVFPSFSIAPCWPNVSHGSVDRLIHCQWID